MPIDQLGNPEKEWASLLGRFDAFAEEVVARQLDRVRASFEVSEKRGEVTRQDTENAVGNTRARYDKSDFPHRVFNIANNIRFWFPGGYYRDALAERRQALQEGDPFFEDDSEEKIQEQERMLVDVDALIRSRGMEDVASRIVADDPTLDRIEKANAYVRIYTALREKGYSHEALTN